MKIKKIIIENFRAFRHEEIEFNDFNCIIGKNDSGKSTILAALNYFFDSTKFVTIYDYNGIINEYDTFDAPSTYYIDIIISVENDIEDFRPFNYNDMIMIKKQYKLCPAFQKCDFDYYFVVKDDFIESNYFVNDILIRQFDFDNGYLRPNTEIKRANGYMYIPISGVSPWSLNWLFNILPKFKVLTSTTSLSGIQDIFIRKKFFNEIRVLSKSIRHLQFGKKSKLHFDTLNLSFSPNILTEIDGKHVPLDNRGDGILLETRFCLFNELAKFDEMGDYIFAFEEPETHLHPKAQLEMYDSIKKLSKNNQVIITTHSPYIVKELAKDSTNPIVVTREEESNESKINKLDRIKVLPYDSMNEINYIAFDLASEEYHQELYGQIEIDWFGESNGSKIDQIINKLQYYKCENRDKTFGEIVKTLIDNYNNANKSHIDLLSNKFVSPDKGKEPSRCFCHCVRNSIDHPCEGNAKWKEYGLIDLSIKILLEINNCFNDIKKTFFEKINLLTDLDIFPNKVKYCIDEDGNNEQEHSTIYWLKYNYIDKKELFKKKYEEKAITTEKIIKIKKEKDKHLLDILNAVNLLNNYADKRSQNS